MIRSISPFVAGYFLIYALNLWFASTIDGFPLEEAMGVMVVMGIGFSLVAHFISWKAITLGEPKGVQRSCAEGMPARKRY